MPNNPNTPKPTRRTLITSAAALATTGTLAACNTNTAHADRTQHLKLKGNIKQSMVNWCYNKHFKSVDDMCLAANRLGLKSIELISPKEFPTLKKHGLACAITGSHGFKQGMNDPDFHPTAIKKIKDSIDANAQYGFKSVISFTGFANGRSLEEGFKNCVEGYKKVIAYAEKKGVTICLEHLNTRADDHPMKGHPGYQGNHIDYCFDIAKAVGSPNMKVLFDIYHVQIMDGDVIRRIRKYHDLIGHVHTAGNPGRGELDDQQEINYPPIMRALLEVKYKGYVGQEFIPTRDAYEGLKQAVLLCDV